MWVVAFLGASTAYAESTLSQIYKERDPITGQYRGGPAYYFEKGLGQKWYAILFAVAMIISCGVFLPGVQANGVASAVTRITGEGNLVNFLGLEVGTLRIAVMAVVVVAVGVIILGGIKRIASFAEIVVPFMAVSYIMLALLIMVMNLDKIPAVFGLIMGDIFNPMAGFGAAIGWVLSVACTQTKQVKVQVHTTRGLPKLTTHLSKVLCRRFLFMWTHSWYVRQRHL